MDILIKNGTVVTAEQTFKADIHISNGKIKSVAGQIPPADNIKLIDAKGMYLMPGGIDPHVHMHLPTPAGFSSDDFKTGSKAALYGGTTTIIDFVTPNKGQALPEALKARKNEALNCLCDYSFHVSPVDFNDRTEQDISEILNAGINSFKVYTAYAIGLNDADLQKVMNVIAKKGGLITVHAELGDEIDKLRAEYAASGKLSPEYHPKSRPDYTEADAVKKVIEFADKAGCPLYIVHVSSQKSIEHITKAQKKGQSVYAETCPQYLLLDDRKFKGNFAQTAAYVFSPPLRKKADNDGLWQALKTGTIQTVGTDHCPFTFNQKSLGKADFTKIPNGAGGVEHRLSLLYTYGVLKNKISLNQFVNLSSTQAAKIFGLYPQKGEIAVGSDADIVIWNPDTEQVISTETHHQNCDLNIYEGFKTKGAPEYVLLRGQIMLENGKFLNTNQSGKFLKRKL